MQTNQSVDITYIFNNSLVVSVFHVETRGFFVLLGCSQALSLTRVVQPFYRNLMLCFHENAVCYQRHLPVSHMQHRLGISKYTTSVNIGYCTQAPLTSSLSLRLSQPLLAPFPHRPIHIPPHKHHHNQHHPPSNRIQNYPSITLTTP